MSATDHPADTTSRLPRDFWRLWGSSTSSNLGDGVRLTALPLLAAAIDPRPVVVASLSALGYVPWLVFALIAGGVADRADRRRLMVRLQLVRIVILALFAVTVSVGRANMVLLFAVALAMGVAEVFFDSTAATVLPSVLPVGQLERGNSRLYSAELTANELVGSPLGAGLFAWQVAAPFWFGLAGSAASGLLLSRIGVSFNPPADERDDPDATTPSLMRSIRDGVRLTLSSRFLRAWTFVLAMANLSRAMTVSVFVLYVLDLLHESKLAFGVLSAMVAVGGVAGGWRADRVIETLGRRTAALGGFGLVVTSHLLLGLVLDPVVAGAAGILFGIGIAVTNVLFVSTRQKIVPGDFLGRVASVQRFVAWGSLPLGALLGGWLAQTWNLRVPYLVAAAVVSAFVVVFGRGLLDFPETRVEITGR